MPANSSPLIITLSSVSLNDMSVVHFVAVTFGMVASVLIIVAL